MEERLGKEGRQNLGTGKPGGSESEANIQVSDSGMGCVGPPQRREPKWRRRSWGRHGGQIGS